MSGKNCLYDEWREEKDIVELATYQAFNFHEDQIKLALDSKKKEPDIILN